MDKKPIPCILVIDIFTEQCVNYVIVSEVYGPCVYMLGISYLQSMKLGHLPINVKWDIF